MKTNLAVLDTLPPVMFGFLGALLLAPLAALHVAAEVQAGFPCLTSLSSHRSLPDMSRR